ncbi:hypothetical protein BIW11_02664 [Tropilaelaps mercedesae]|uniref:Uncharacterized protein n=1 Tax=Tropilaelaps mercedesae TaxID=418985 RepID=A0A1V9XZC3_9ACAR|nr:hypothetical protein BIW11_02664 [Tropilaelaps mercedesae]
MALRYEQVLSISSGPLVHQSSSCRQSAMLSRCVSYALTHGQTLNDSHPDRWQTLTHCQDHFFFWLNEEISLRAFHRHSHRDPAREMNGGDVAVRSADGYATGSPFCQRLREQMDAARTLTLRRRDFVSIPSLMAWYTRKALTAFGRFERLFTRPYTLFVTLAKVKSAEIRLRGCIELYLELLENFGVEKMRRQQCLCRGEKSPAEMQPQNGHRTIFIQERQTPLRVRAMPNPTVLTLGPVVKEKSHQEQLALHFDVFGRGT